MTQQQNQNNPYWSTKIYPRYNDHSFCYYFSFPFFSPHICVETQTIQVNNCLYMWNLVNLIDKFLWHQIRNLDSNFTNIKNVIRKCNLMINLLKFISNKNIYKRNLKNSLQTIFGLLRKTFYVSFITFYLLLLFLDCIYLSLLVNF